MNYKQRILNVLNVQSNEVAKVITAYAFALLIGLIRIFTMTIALSLFLNDFTPTSLSKALIISGIITTIIGLTGAYVFSFKTRTISTLIIMLIINGVMYILLLINSTQIISYIFFIIYLIEESILNSLLWGVINKIFDIRQAKRFFGLLGSADNVITVIGGLLIGFLVLFINTVHLMTGLIVTLFLTLCLIIYILKKYENKKDSIDVLFASEDDESAVVKSNKRYYFTDKYIRNLFFLGVVWIATIYVLDVVYFDSVQTLFNSTQQISLFVALFSAASAGFGLFSQFFLYPIIMKKGGIPVALLIPPGIVIILTATSLIMFILPISFAYALICIIIVKFIEVVSNDFLTTPSFYTLFYTLPEKYQDTALYITETIVIPAATAITGTFILIIGSYIKNTGILFSIILICVQAAWIILALFISKGYIKLLQQSVFSPGFFKNQSSLAPHKIMEAVKQTLTSGNKVEIYSALDLINENIQLYKKELSYLLTSDSDIRSRVYSLIEKKPGQEFSDLLLNRIELEQDDECIPFLCKALASVLNNDSIFYVKKCFSSEKTEIIDAATYSILNYIDDNLKTSAISRLKNLILSADEKNIIHALSIIKDIQKPIDLGNIDFLWSHKNFKVKQTLLKAMLHTVNTSHYPYIVIMLDNYHTRNEAINILLENFSIYWTLFKDTYKNTNSDNIRYSIINVLERNKSDKSLELLILFLQNAYIKEQSLIINALTTFENYNSINNSLLSVSFCF